MFQRLVDWYEDALIPALARHPGGNTFLWFHMLAGAAAGRIGRGIGLEWAQSTLIVFVAGFGWEMFQYIAATKRGELDTPGKRKAFFLDALEDLAFETATAALAA